MRVIGVLWARSRPADDPAITDEMWAAPARAHFKGDVVVGKDLMEI